MRLIIWGLMSDMFKQKTYQKMKKPSFKMDLFKEDQVQTLEADQLKLIVGSYSAEAQCSTSNDSDPNKSDDCSASTDADLDRPSVP
jgi:hypothetical protein